MKTSQLRKPAFLKASDLEISGSGLYREVECVIDEVRMTKVGPEEKPVMGFKDRGRGLVLNKTNLETLEAAYGDETEAWKGKPVVLFVAMVEFKGERRPALRVRIPPQAEQAFDDLVF